MERVELSAWQQHREKWAGGCGSAECERATRVVLGRGTVPADILLLGESPGISENQLGVPFCGVSGSLLDHIINQSIHSTNSLRLIEKKKRLSYAITNLVGCFPRESEGSGKAAKPEDDQIRACGPRLIEFVEICNPKLLICVGTLAEGWTDPTMKNRIAIRPGLVRIAIKHPAAILRAPQVQKGLMVQRCIVQIRQALEGWE